MRTTLFQDGIARLDTTGLWHLMNKAEPERGWSTKSIPFSALDVIVATYAVTVGELREDKWGPYVELKRVVEGSPTDFEALRAAEALRLKAQVALELAEATVLGLRLRAAPAPAWHARARAHLSKLGALIQEARTGADVGDASALRILGQDIRQRVLSLLAAIS